jgi:hypothetical protein
MKQTGNETAVITPTARVTAARLAIRAAGRAASPAFCFGLRSSCWPMPAMPVPPHAESVLTTCRSADPEEVGASTPTAPPPTRREATRGADPGRTPPRLLFIRRQAARCVLPRSQGDHHVSFIPGAPLIPKPGRGSVHFQVTSTAAAARTVLVTPVTTTDRLPSPARTRSPTTPQSQVWGASNVSHHPVSFS